jgi:glycosyltransferase involved in cell wall biosynthesis
MIAAHWPLSGRNLEQPTPARNVLMITGRADFGGGPEHVYQLARVISRTTVVHIACPREEPYWSRYESIVGPDRMVEIPHRRVSVGAFARIARYIRVRGIDVVHAHGRTGGIYARPAALLAGVRCFYTPNGSTPVAGLRTAIYAAVEYLLSIVTQGVVAVSNTEAVALRPLCAFRGRLEVIQNGVEIPPPLDAPDNRLTAPLRVVHVTRYVFQKNTGLLVDVIAALRDMGQLDPFEFLLLGDGPGRPEFEAAIAERGLGHCLKILGAVTNPGAYLASAFCLISTSRWEGLPIALLEAMARGVPAIATDVIGNKDAVTDQETGFLYDPCVPEAAAQRLVQLARNPPLWKQMVRAARRKAEQEFSVEVMADSTLRLYSRSTRSGERTDPRRARFAPPVAPLPLPAVAGGIHSSRIS